MSQAPLEFHFSTVTLLPHERLGNGSYGIVCKALCDQLPCAAKVMHPVFFQYGDPGNQTMLQKFVRECHLLSAIKHPCIVQYLGHYTHPETGLPILLMELMDESLTKFLERSSTSLPFHLQVSINHDITLALSYLHLNGIMHCDLSSNNVLMMAGSKAKVTDFGMAKLVEVNPRMTPLAQCPGTQVYMAPEALRTPPRYTEKLDVFSAGVLMIQVISLHFPSPALPKRTVNDPRYPGHEIEVPVAELERRHFDISLVDPNHPLCSTALACLADVPTERPTAHDLSRHLYKLRESAVYKESMKQVQSKERMKQVQSAGAEIHSLKEEVAQLKHKLNWQIRRTTEIEHQKGEEIKRLSEEKRCSMGEIKRLWEEKRCSMEEIEQLRRQLKTLRGKCDYSDPDEDMPDNPVTKNVPITSPNGWYHGKITRDESVRRVKRVGRAGAYLLRESESQAGMVLTLMDKEREVHHYKLDHNKGEYSIGGNYHFPTLQRLVHFYAQNPVLGKQYLELPVAPPQPVPLPDGCQ